MKTFTIAAVALRKLLRDRTGLFFVLLFPVIITLLIGFAIFGQIAAGFSVGVLNEDSGRLSRDLVRALESSKALTVENFDDRDSLETAVRRDSVRGGIVIPEGYERRLRAGEEAQVLFLPSPRSGSTAAVQSETASLVTEQGAAVRAALFATQNADRSFDENLEAGQRLLGADQSRVTVSAEIYGDPEEETQFQGFNYPSASNLILFVFITSLTAASQLIEAKRLGISRRMLGTPTSSRTILLGQTLGRFVIALFQGLFIFVAGALLFDVQWGSPLGTAAVIVSFSLVATGMAVLFGTLLRTPEQAGLGVPLGIGMGMLGGCMWPLEIVNPTMRTVGHFTPHAWAMDGFIALLRGGGIGEITGEIGVLLAIAAVLLTFSIYRFRRTLTS